MAQFSHPHIVGVIDAGEDEGRPYIVFEYVEGETLKDRIRRLGRLPIAEAVAYAIEIARALGAAHARHIVHRDVKPQNVLIDEEGRAKVTDFGIARTLDEDGLTADGLLGPATRKALGLPAGAILRPNAAYFAHKRVKRVHHVTHHVTHHARNTSSSGYAIPSQVVQCESGGNPSAVSPYSGGGLYGILDSTWQAYGGTAYAPHPYDASASQQGAIARKILASELMYALEMTAEQVELHLD